MRIDWNIYRVHAKQGGLSHWPRGFTREYSWPGIVQDQDLVFITEGEGRILTREGWADLMPGCCLWLLPGFYYDAMQNPDNPLSMYYIHFDLLGLDGTLRNPEAPRPPEVIQPTDAPSFDLIFHRLTQLTTWTNSPTGLPTDRQMRADAWLTALLTELDAATQGETSPLLAGTHKYHYNAVIQTMQQILADPSQPLSVTELAESAGYSMEHFSRVFRKITGRSPQQYIIHARTVRACELLNHTSLSIAEIAAQLGYDSPYFFSRQFKQQTGVNPREGRQILSGADPQGRTLYASNWEWSQRNRPSSRDGFSNQSRERKQKIDKTTNPK